MFYSTNTYLLLGDSTVVTEPYFPSLSYSYQMGVEAIILDKKQTIEAQVYYSYYMNRAAISVTKEGRTFKNIYNFDADEIYKTSGKTIWFKKKIDKHCQVLTPAY